MINFLFKLNIALLNIKYWPNSTVSYNVHFLYGNIISNSFSQSLFADCTSLTSILKITSIFILKIKEK